MIHLNSRNIIITGYPKSGNTWVTRLTAELVNCPVAGFWGEEDRKEIAQEGERRNSEYLCYKSHNGYGVLADLIRQKNVSIIYVLRDPRDIAVSGAHFFLFHRYKRIFELCQKNGLKSIYSKYVYPLLSSESYRISQMIDVVINGNKNVSWCEISWWQHCKQFSGSGVLFVKYENMLIDPFNECCRILNHLGLKRDTYHVRQSIENQSFSKKKNMFAKRGYPGKASFMRVGKSEQWRVTFNKKQKQIFETQLSEELNYFSYNIF